MDQVTMNSSQQDNESVISSGDRLTIETIADFIRRIRKGLAEAATVTIAFEPNMEMDSTALQVFCSACKTATAEGKRLRYRRPLPQALLDLSGAIGAELREHCSSNNSSCFLKSGGGEEWQR